MVVNVIKRGELIERGKEDGGERNKERGAAKAAHYYGHKLLM